MLHSRAGRVPCCLEFVELIIVGVILAVEFFEISVIAVTELGQ